MCRCHFLGEAFHGLLRPPSEAPCIHTTAELPAIRELPTFWPTSPDAWKLFLRIKTVLFIILSLDQSAVPDTENTYNKYLLNE